MTSRERPVDRGNRISTADLDRTCIELRQARVAAGLSVAAVGRAARLSASEVSRIERGRIANVSLRRLATIGAAVGLDVRVRAYPGPDPIRDIAQVRLLERLRARLPGDQSFRTEVPLPIAGDQRAWDGWIGGLQMNAGGRRGLPVEAETRISDLQAQLRRLVLKMRDGDADHVLLVIADTPSNRAAIRVGGTLLRDLFPITPRRAMRAIAEGRHPAGSACIFL